jgi:putative molybdopterin biosynthesis protein
MTGNADARPGILTIADQNGLHFVPLRDEEYDFVVRSPGADKPAIKAFLEILRSEQFRSRLKTLGYRAQT